MTEQRRPFHKELDESEPFAHDRTSASAFAFCELFSDNKKF